MNWGRLRLVLAVAFLMLDLFLGAELWFRPPANSTTVISGDVMNQLNRELENTPLKVDGLLPATVSSLSLIGVERLSDKGFAQLLAHRAVLRSAANRARYRSRLWSVAFSTDGSFVASRVAPAGHHAPVSEAQAEHVVRAFLRRRGLGTWQILSVAAKPSSYVVQLRPLSGRWPIYDLTWQARVRSDGSLASLAGPAVVFRGSKPPSQPTETSPEAVLDLAAYWREHRFAPTTITNVRLGYLGQQYQAISWQDPPAWRLRLASGQIAYVNALTGEVELLVGPATRAK